MKSIGRLIFVLVVISSVSALGLSWVEAVTRDRIAEEIRKDTREAVQAVALAFDNDPVQEAADVEGFRYYPVRRKGELAGLAMKVETREGYGGRIAALLGMTPEGRVTGVKILTHAETPGLGSKFAEAEYLDQFVGKTLDNADWAVRKDGGDFDQITGATITPRALIRAMEEGLRAYRQDRSQVRTALAQRPAERDEDGVR